TNAFRGSTWTRDSAILGDFNDSPGDRQGSLGHRQTERAKREVQVDPDFQPQIDISIARRSCLAPAWMRRSVPTGFLRPRNSLQELGRSRTAPAVLLRLTQTIEAHINRGLHSRGWRNW